MTARALSEHTFAEQQAEIEKLQRLLKDGGGDRDVLIKAKAVTDQELAVLKNELLVMRKKVRGF